MEPKLLVVGGVMRGGTTLLRGVLASHPAIALFSRELRALAWHSQPLLLHVARVHHHLFLANRWIRHPEFYRQVYRYLWSLLRENGLFREQVTVDMCHDAFAACLAQDGKLYVGDKYPDYVFHHQKFTQRPDCRTLLIVRDPRDVVASILQRIRKGDWAGRSWAKKYSSIDGASHYWNEAAQVMASLNHSNSGALVIRYEDLVMAGRDTVARIAGYLELDPGGFNSSAGHGSSLGKHKQNLDEREVREIEKKTAGLMAAFGYGSIH